MDQASSSSSSSSHSNTLGGRAIDRHNPIIRDSRRTPSRDFSSSSKPPIDPKPSNAFQKAKNKSSSKLDEHNKRTATKDHHNQKKKSAAEKLTEHIANYYSCKPINSILRKSWVRPPVDLVTSAGSSRYLLGESTSSFGGVSDHMDPILASTRMMDYVVHQDETNHASKPSSSSAPKSGSSLEQVVVLRVSLHCKGCEGKVRKHLSRMQGVKSFNIDFVAKKVTVVGDVTPLTVLASLSKVKNAQIWPAGGSGSIAEARKKNFMI